MLYIALKNNEWMLDNYTVLPLREQDIYDIMHWRNSQVDVLRQEKKLTRTDQEAYFQKIVQPGFAQASPGMMLFSFLQNDSCIGYGGLTNMSWTHKRAELSFLLDTERVSNDAVYKKDFSAFITLMKSILFTDLQFNRLFTETFDIRPLHISILEENGFVLEGRMRQHVLIDGIKTDSLIHGFIKEQYGL